jgi:hypothetical protein
MTMLKRIGVAVATALSTFAAAGLLVRAQQIVNPGDPLPGITPVEFTEFRLGLDDFTEVESVNDGLGPAFNGTSCAVCHNVPAIGGTGLILETRAAHRDASGEFHALNAAGDTLMHLFSVPTHACQPILPADANVVAHRQAIPLFGAGLVEAIPDETLRALEDPFDRNNDGVRGRAALVADLATGERPSAASAGKRSTRRCWRSPPTRIATRWASPTICCARNTPMKSATTGCGAAIRFRTSRTGAIR